MNLINFVGRIAFSFAFKVGLRLFFVDHCLSNLVKLDLDLMGNVFLGHCFRVNLSCFGISCSNYVWIRVVTEECGGR